jgi:CheY-like chemotaxis protein
MAEDAGPLLLVEDDDDIREIVGEALRSAGHDVRVAATGDEALAQARRAPRPRAIFLDMTLPDMDGWRFLDEKARDADIAGIPVIVVTASGRAAQTRAGADVVAWLAKPVELDELLAAAEAASPTGRTVAAAADLDPAEARAYLERKRGNLAAIDKALADGVHDELRRFGHNLRGGAASYGHPLLGAIGARLEAAAVAADVGAETAAVAELAGYLRARP